MHLSQAQNDELNRLQAEAAVPSRSSSPVGSMAAPFSDSSYVGPAGRLPSIENLALPQPAIPSGAVTEQLLNCGDQPRVDRQWRGLPLPTFDSATPQSSGATPQQQLQYRQAGLGTAGQGERASMNLTTLQSPRVPAIKAEAAGVSYDCDTHPYQLNLIGNKTHPAMPVHEERRGQSRYVPAPNRWHCLTVGGKLGRSPYRHDNTSGYQKIICSQREGSRGREDNRPCRAACW